MRIDLPSDQPTPTGSSEPLRPVEEVARASSAVEKSALRDVGSDGSGAGSFAQLVDRHLVGSDSATVLDDPDRDAWTQELIGSRILWQYGPDGKRKPFFRHQTRRLDDPNEEEATARPESSAKPPQPPRGS